MVTGNLQNIKIIIFFLLLSPLSQNFSQLFLKGNGTIKKIGHEIIEIVTDFYQKKRCLNLGNDPSL